MPIEETILIGALLAAFIAAIIQRDRLARKLQDAKDLLALQDAELSRCNREHRRRKPEDFPPGAIPVELALAVHEEWRKAGYHMLGDTRVVVRLLSIAHRVMCQVQPGAASGVTYNDGDRSPPAKVACVATGKRPCTWPDCHCPAIEPPPPPPPTDKPYRKP